MLGVVKLEIACYILDKQSKRKKDKRQKSAMLVSEEFDETNIHSPQIIFNTDVIRY